MFTVVKRHQKSGVFLKVLLFDFRVQKQLAELNLQEDVKAVQQALCTSSG